MMPSSLSHAREDSRGSVAAVIGSWNLREQTPPGSEIRRQRSGSKGNSTARSDDNQELGLHQSYSGQSISGQSYSGQSINYEPTSRVDLAEFLAKVRSLPEVLTAATDVLVKTSAETQTQLKDMMTDLQRELSSQLESQRQSWADMQLHDGTFHHKWKLAEPRSSISSTLSVQAGQDEGKLELSEVATPVELREIHHKARFSEQFAEHREMQQPREEVDDKKDHDVNKASSSKKISTPAMKHDSKDIVSAIRQISSTAQDAIHRHLAHRREEAESSNVFKDVNSGHLLPVSRMVRIVHGDAFTILCSIFIVSNTIALGAQTDFEIRAAIEETGVAQPGWIRPANLILTILFTLELGMRFAAEHKYFFIGLYWRWNVLDTILICCAITEEILADNKFNFTVFRMIRIVKMCRTIRVLRVFRMFKDLRLMVTSILLSGKSLLSAVFLLLVLIYCSAVCICQGVTYYFETEDKLDPVDQKLLEEFYGSVPTAMYTLVKAISGGKDWDDLVAPLTDVSVFYVVVFVVYTLFAVFGLLNVVTGIFVDRASELSHLDRDLAVEAERSKVKAFRHTMRKVFTEMDHDGLGYISFSNFKEYCERDDVRAYLSNMELAVDETEELFHMLDTHHTGHVNIEDFISGCLRVKGLAKSLDVMHLAEDVSTVKRMLLVLGDQLSACCEVLELSKAQFLEADAKQL